MKHAFIWIISLKKSMVIQHPFIYFSMVYVNNLILYHIKNMYIHLKVYVDGADSPLNQKNTDTTKLLFF